MDIKKPQIKIALIIGHNAAAQGKWRFGTSEFKFWSEFFDDYLDDFNDAHTCRVFKRPVGVGYYDQMRDVHARIDAWGAHISVECHYNASASSATGYEVLYYNKSPGGKLTAALFDKALDTHLNTRDRGLKPRGYGERGAFGLKVGKAKSILIEPFFSKELRDFVRGGDKRAALVDVFKTFLELVDAVDTKQNSPHPTEKPKPILHKRNAELSDEEVAWAIQVLNA